MRIIEKTLCVLAVSMLSLLPAPKPTADLIITILAIYGALTLYDNFRKVH